MSFFGDIFDDVFGGESDRGLTANREEFARRQEAVERNAALARQDTLDIYPRGQEALQQGLRAAIDVARRTPQAQNRVLQKSGLRAQEALLAGSNAFRQAIMGLPTGMGAPYQNPYGLRPMQIGADAGANLPFYASQQPMFLGTQEEDGMEAALRRNPGILAQLWQSNPQSLAQAQALFPERFRQVPRRMADGRYTGGVPLAGSAT
jgi:hypothetical protein